jgi:hypothetical protein
MYYAATLLSACLFILLKDASSGKQIASATKSSPPNMIQSSPAKAAIARTIQMANSVRISSFMVIHYTEWHASGNADSTKVFMGMFALV